MRSPKLYILCIISVFVASAAWAKYQFVAPHTFDQKVDVQIAGKTRSYYELTGNKTVTVMIQGPVKLRVISRALLDAHQDSVEYSFLAKRGGNSKPFTIDQRSHLFDNGSLLGEGGGSFTASRTHIIDVPRGDQTYTFSLPHDSKQSVLLRFARDTNAFAQNEKVVAMTPATYTNRVDVVTHEEASAYYRLSSKDKIILKLIGPATLKVLNRIEFDQNMTGKQKWRVQVIEDGKIKATHSFAANSSQLTTYRESAPYVPSRADAFYVEVPEGSHDYEFRLPDNHRSALFRFLLPEKQLGKN